MPAPQNYSNHARFDPKFHFLLVPMILVVLVYTAVTLYRSLTLAHGMAVLAAAALLLLALIARMYALQVQDRLIHLEESLRLHSLGGSTAGLTPKQCVGLRFASDAEAVALAERSTRENLTPKQIKQAVQHWRADHFRV